MTAAAWHALPPDEVLRRLQTSSEGLTPDEARARLARVGPNALRTLPPVSVWRILFAQIRSVVVALLVAASAVAAVSGDWLDAAAIASVLVINVAIGVATELPARRVVEALGKLEVRRAAVLRGGEVRDVDARELVPGDVIVLEAGQAVPADGRLLRAFDLRAVEAPLTGESAEVAKHTDGAAADVPVAERANMVYAATTVAAGSGAAVVVATAMDTEVGRIGALMSGITPPRTPLERRLDALGQRLAVLALAVAALVAGLGLLQGTPLRDVIDLGLALAVAAVPEGLPAVVTIAMALGVRRMARRQALVRRLAAVETLGSATVICSDKTGTLTTGQMTVTTLWVPDREIEVTGAGVSPEGSFRTGGDEITPAEDGQLVAVLETAALSSRAGLALQNGEWVARGDPTDVALLVAARKGEVNRGRLLEMHPETGEVPFSSERMVSASLHRTARTGTLACVKGAPTRVLERCDRMLGVGGPHPLDEPGRRAILERNAAFAVRGLRVVALARGLGAEADASTLEHLEFLGLAGLNDPPAPGVADTVRSVQAAGVRTIMLTGDQRLTAEAVGRAVGLLAPGDLALDARELDRLSEAELDEQIERVAVVSRVAPDGKLRIVRALRRRGAIVAMLGDGVNDAPALRQADIGITMGRRGTDVAKEASDVVLQDDRFQTIGVALEEGRVIYDNIRKFVLYLFSCNLAEILVFLGAGVVGWAAPLAPLQILWLNLVTDTFPALALGMEPAEPDVMRRPPRDPRATLLSGRMLRVTLGYALLIAVVTLAAFAWGLWRWPLEPARATTLAFMTLAAAQILHLGNARSPAPVVAPRRAVANRFALGAVALTLGLQLAAVFWSPLANVLGVRPPTGVDWAVIAGLALLPAVVGQIIKRFRRPPA
ncbi:MAG TPA: cation-transporting P-type ATPase [Gemmatimonadales bacterium]